MNRNASNYYGLLGVSRSATDAEIKKAYRKLAMKHHPDRGGDPELFKQVAEAYAVLSDPDKRKMYNLLGEDGVRMQEEAEGTPFTGNPFGGMGGGMPFPFPGMGGGGMPFPFPGGFGGGVDPFEMFEKFASGRPGEDGLFDDSPPVDVTLDQLYHGDTVRTKVSPKKPCVACKGTGKTTKSLGLGMLFKTELEVMCPECQGRKTVRSEGNAKTVKIKVHPGTKNGAKVRVRGVGEGVQELKIRQLPHARFERKGADLACGTTIRWSDALLRRPVPIEHLDGSTVWLSFGGNPSVPVAPGTLWRIKGKGMPLNRKKTQFGDLVVLVKISFPKWLSEDQRQALHEAFPTSKIPGETDAVCEGTLTKPTPKDSTRGSVGGCPVQ